MKKFELERLQKIEEISPIIRTVTIILVAVALFTSFSFEFTFPWLGIPPLALFLFIVVFEKIRLLFFPLEETTPTLINYLGLLFNTLFIVFVVILTGGPISPFKILFLPVILLYTLKFGTLWGVAVSTIASACLLLLHLREANILASPNAYLEADFITVSMIFMTSWLIGTISGTERTIRSRLTEQANRDALTGLYSHRYFHQVLEKKIQEHKSHKKIGLTMLDLDHFNYYNDVFGYQAGDKYLQDVAIILHKIIPATDYAFRYGGDEFAVIMENTSPKELYRTAQKIRKSINAHTFNVLGAELDFKPTASLGLAIYPLQAKNKNDLLQKVDNALYKAKINKHSKVEIFYSVLDQLKERLNESEKNLIETIRTLLTIINIKDQYTYGHSERVLIYSTMIAKGLNLPSREVLLIQYGAFLHDIGKIEIDRKILNKPGILTEEEMKTIQMHPVWGTKIIAPILELRSVTSYILHHHEHYNGQGYPHGLAGEDIPLGARILAIADAFDALTTDRPYRMGCTLEEAIEVLKQNSGKQFDPFLTNIFLEEAKAYDDVETLLNEKKEAEIFTLLNSDS